MLPPLLGDGHTGLGVDKLFTGLEDRIVFPYYAKLDPDRSYIYLPEPGWEIISVNGIPSQTIMDKMMEYASGESPAFRMIRIEEYFPFYMKMLYPAEKYRIKYRTTGSDKVLSKTVYPAELGPEARNPSSLNESVSSYSYAIREDISTAILYFNSFNYLDEFCGFLEEMFGEIRNKEIKNLIIDLRYNGGGNSDLGDELFQYI